MLDNHRPNKLILIATSQDSDAANHMTSWLNPSVCIIILPFCTCSLIYYTCWSQWTDYSKPSLNNSDYASWLCPRQGDNVPPPPRAVAIGPGHAWIRILVLSGAELLSFSLQSYIHWNNQLVLFLVACTTLIQNHALSPSLRRLRDASSCDDVISSLPSSAHACEHPALMLYVIPIFS